MSQSRLLLQQKDAISELTQRLRDCPLIARYGTEEPTTLVHALSDIEESFHTFLEDQLPRIVDPRTRDEALEDLLLDIREEVRHILYHLQDPEFFRMIGPSHPDAET